VIAVGSTDTVYVAKVSLTVDHLKPIDKSNQVLVTGDDNKPTWVDQSTLSIEPWNVQGADTKATGNTQNIYQQGKVGIGLTKDDVTTKTLEVKGDFKVEGKTGTTYNGIVTNQALGGEGYNLVYSSKAPFTSYESLIEQDKNSSILTTAGGTNVVSKGVNHTASSTVNAIDTMYSIQMIGEQKIGAKASSTFWMNPSNTHISQRDETNKTEVSLGAGKGVMFSYEVGNKKEGSYMFPTNNGNVNQVLVTDGHPVSTGEIAKLSWKNVTDIINPGTTGQVLTTVAPKDGESTPTVEWQTPAKDKATVVKGATDNVAVTQGTGNDAHVYTVDVKAAMPKVFYMPPVMFDTSKKHNVVQTRNLYEEYVAMFGGTQNVVDTPIDGTRPGLVKNGGAEKDTIPTFAANQLDFYVAYYDPAVFENVKVSDAGVLTYTVKKKAKYGAFMTVVFVVRDSARK